LTEDPPVAKTTIHFEIYVESEAGEACRLSIAACSAGGSIRAVELRGREDVTKLDAKRKTGERAVSPLATSCIALAFIFAGTFLGMFLRTTLSEHQLNNDAKDVVRLGVGLVATIVALVLGLLIASAKSSYDTQSSQITRMTANLILLDRILAQYGPDAAPARDLLRRSVAPMVERIWRENGSDSAQAAPFEPNAAAEAVYGELQELSPRTDAERSLQARAIQIGTELAQTRLLLFTETGNSIPRPFLVILVYRLPHRILFPLLARLGPKQMGRVGSALPG
jgi:hypothetical protein